MIITLQCTVHDPYLHLLIVVVVVVCDHQLSSGGAVVGGRVEDHQVGQLLLPPLVSLQDVQVLPPVVNVALAQTLPGDRVPVMLVLPTVVMRPCQTLLAVHHLSWSRFDLKVVKLSDEFETRRSSYDAAVHPPALSCAQLSDLVAANKQLLLTR